MNRAISSRLGWCSSKQIQPASPSSGAGRGGPVSRLLTEKQGCYVNLATPLTWPSNSVYCCGVQTSGPARATRDWPGLTASSTGDPARANCLKSTSKLLAGHQCREWSGVNHVCPNTSHGHVWRRSWCHLPDGVPDGPLCHTPVHLLAADHGRVYAHTPDASPDYALPLAGFAVR